MSPPDQQPAPKPKPERPVHDPLSNPQGGEDTSRPEGAGSHGQQGESGAPPDKVKTTTPGNGLAQAPAQSEGQPDKGTDNEGGRLPAAVGKGSGDRGTGYERKTANAPAGEPPSGTGMAQHPDRQAASAALPGHEPGSGNRSTTAVGREDAVRPAGDSSLQDQQVVGHSQAVEAASPAAPEGGERPPSGYGVRAASEAPLGSMEFFFGYLWDGSSFSVQQDQVGLGLVRDGARGSVSAASHGGTLTQRAPPLQIPSPFSGFGLTMGGLVFSASSSGDGALLFAVIFCCLFAVLWRERSRAYGALLRAGTVPRLALERPG